MPSLVTAILLTTIEITTNLNNEDLPGTRPRRSASAVTVARMDRATSDGPRPRVVVAGTHSGVGKTTVATGLLAALRPAGRRPATAKVGPDFIDPGYHALACDRPPRNLDAWMCGPEPSPRWPRGPAPAPTCWWSRA